MKKSKAVKPQAIVEEKVYCSEVIPDKLTEEIDRDNHESVIREQDERLANKKHRELLRQQRIVNTVEDKYLHTINLLLDRAEQKKIKNRLAGNNSAGIGFSVRWDFFNFEDNSMLKSYLNELKSKGCFDWQINPFKPDDRTEFVFTHISPESLLSEKIARETVRFAPGETVLYSKGVVYLKQVGGLPASVDFGTAPAERAIMDILMELRADNPGQDNFTNEDILERYTVLNGKSITLRQLDVSISNIKKRVIKKRLERRLKLSSDPKTKMRIFQLF